MYIQTYEKKAKAVYCVICIVFSISETNFSTGCKNFKNIYQFVEKREKSYVHNQAIYSRHFFKHLTIIQ